MMASLATFTENNSPGEYATLMARTNTPMEHFLRVYRRSAQTTSANGITANVPVTTTIDFHFIPIEGITISEVDTSRWGATFLSPRDIATLGETTETHFPNKNNLSVLFLGVLLHLVVQLLSELVTKPMLTIWSTPVEETSIRTYYDIGPEKTHESLSRGYTARLARAMAHYGDKIDIDIPVIDDGGDW